MELNPISKCDTAIELIEAGLASQSEVMQAMAFKQKLGEIYRAINFRFEQAAIKWIEINGDIEDGTKRYYVGTQTARKCKNVPETIRTILEANGADALVTVLSSSCFRPASAMEILGDRAEEFFETVVEKDLKTGAPKKKFKTTQPKELSAGASEESDE